MPEISVNGGWPFACIASGVVDLNRLFSGSASSLDAVLGSPALTTNLQANGSSFADALAGAQASSVPSQDETSNTTAAGLQLPNQYLWNTSQGQAFPGGSDDGSTVPTSQLPSALKGSQAKPVTVSSPTPQDVYVPNNSRSQNPAASAQDDSSPASDSDPSSATKRTSATKPGDKLKHHNDVTRATASESIDAPSFADSSESSNSLSEGAVAASAPPTLASAAFTNTAQPGKSKCADSGGLAFAVKLQGVGSTTAQDPAPAVTLASNASATLTPVVSSSDFANELSALMSSAKNDVKGQPIAAGKNADSLLVTAASGSQPTLDTTGTETEDTSSAAASTTTEVPADEPVIAQPLKAVQVQITGSDNQKVDLRLIEKSGALTMSVRTADPSLTKELQQNLPQLASKLDGEQIRTEWWKPDGMSSNVAAQSAPKSDSSKDPSTGNQDGQGQNNQGKHGGRNAWQPDWVEELSNLRKSNQNGTQYTWHL